MSDKPTKDRLLELIKDLDKTMMTDARYAFDVRELSELLHKVYDEKYKDNVPQMYFLNVRDEGAVDCYYRFIIDIEKRPGKQQGA